MKLFREDPNGPYKQLPMWFDPKVHVGNAMLNPSGEGQILYRVFVPVDFDISDEVDAVIEAWNVKGPKPWYHARWKRKLMRYWPRLAKALDSLTAALDFSHEQSGRMNN